MMKIKIQSLFVILYILLPSGLMGQQFSQFSFKNLNSPFKIKKYHVQELIESQDIHYFRLSDIRLDKIEKLSPMDFENFKKNGLFVDSLNCKSKADYKSFVDYCYSEIELYVIAQIKYDNHLRSLIILEQSERNVIVYHLVNLVSNKVTSTIQYEVTYIPHSPDDEESTTRSYYLENKCFKYVDDELGYRGTYCITDDGLVAVRDEYKEAISEKEKSLLPKDAEYAMVYFYRPRNSSGSSIGYKIRMDDEIIIGRVRNGEKFSYKVTDFGKHTFWGRAETDASLTLDIQKGQEYYIRCSIKMGIIAGRPGINIVPNHIAREIYDKM